MTRKATNALLDMVKSGMLDQHTVIIACLKYMSEDDVADMCHANDFLPEEEDNEDEEDYEDESSDA